MLWRYNSSFRWSLVLPCASRWSEGSRWSDSKLELKSKSFLFPPWKFTTLERFSRVTFPVGWGRKYNRAPCSDRMEIVKTAVPANFDDDDGIDILETLFFVANSRGEVWTMINPRFFHFHRGSYNWQDDLTKVIKWLSHEKFERHETNQTHGCGLERVVA